MSFAERLHAESRVESGRETEQVEPRWSRGRQELVLWADVLDRLDAVFLAATRPASARTGSTGVWDLLADNPLCQVTALNDLLLSTPTFRNDN